MPEDLHEDIERYINQGGLLGAFTYFLLYVETEDHELASTGAAIPTCLFVMSSLHDDAIDESNSQTVGLKPFLNNRITIGDHIFTHIIEFADELPDQITVKSITSQFRKISAGQLREEQVNWSSLSDDQAVERVEERGSVWGELAVSPVEAGDYYTEKQLNYIDTFCSNLLFILTLVDDVEDIPEDLENDVRNIPLLLYGDKITTYESEESLINDFLESDVPQELDELCEKREQEMEQALSAFANDVDHSTNSMLAAWNETLDWYQNTLCTVPVAETVPEERQSEIHKTLSNDNTENSEYLLSQVAADMPIRLKSPTEFADAVNNLPGPKLAPAVVKMSHIETLVESVMTTTLEDAVDNLERQAPNR